MDLNLSNKISAWLDAHWDEFIFDLERIVRIPSVAAYNELDNDPDAPFGRECARVLDETLALAEGFGMQIKNCEGKCGIMSFRPNENDISVWCHLDVVPAGGGWELTSPFEPVIRDGYMIARGADDNKGPAIGAMYVLRAFNELGIKTKHAIRLCVGCDEEHGMKDVEYYAQNYPAAKLNIIADSGFPVCYGEKGILELNIVSEKPVACIKALSAGLAGNIVPDSASMTVLFSGRQIPLAATGLSRHSAFPEDGINAIHALTEAALKTGAFSGYDEQVLKFFNSINDDYLGTALNINGEDEVSGYTTCVGTMASRLEDGRICLTLNIRYCISANSDKMLESIDKACALNGCRAVLLRDSRPNYFPKEHPAVKALTDLFNEMTGLNKTAFVMGGGTYARKLPNAFAFGLGGLPKEDTKLFKPGHGGAHQPDEGLHLANLKKALNIFAMGLLEADKII